MAISYDNILKESEEFYKNQQEQALTNKNATFDQQVNTVNQNYDFAVKNTNTAYEDKYRQNSIQKLINERQVAENMANMGISNSGLSRSQAAATQLSYANQKGELDRQKQQQVDTLERERASTLTDVESNRRAALDSVIEYYTGLKQDMANSRYNTDTEAETSRLNAQVEAETNYKINQENNAHEKEMLEIQNKADYELQVALKTLGIEADFAKLQYTTEADINKAVAIKSMEIEAEAQQIADKAEADYYRETEVQKIKNAGEIALEEVKNQGKKEEESSYIIKADGGLLSRDFTGTLADNGISVYKNNDGDYVYVDNNSGKKTTLAAGINPFTGTKNKDVDKGKFSNGYQPNNINGVKLTKVEATINVNGNNQSVWKANGEYYFWDGKKNKYEALTTAEKIEVGIYRGRK